MDPAGDRLSPSDAILWQIERDPLLRSTVTAVAFLDRAPDRDRLAARVERATHLVPRLRSRIVGPRFGLGAPRWVPVQDVDLGYHLRRVRVPRPGGMRDVLDLAEPIAMAPFDPARPLWELTVVEGMSSGRAAMIQKFHHCLTDGVGGIELALSLLDPVADPSEDPRPGVDDPPAATGGQAGWSTPALAGLGSAVHAAAHLGGSFLAVPRAALAATSTAVKAATHPLATVDQWRTYAGVVVRTLAPVSSTEGLPHTRGLGRRLHALEVPLADLHDAGHACGGTVNDALLAAVVEGLRRYHSHHGIDVDELSVTMPISFRRRSDELGGNHFTPARFTVPADVDDPLERMRRLGRIARDWQGAPVRQVSSSIAGVLDKLPTPVTAAVLVGLLTSIDTVVTNVPGWTDPMFLAGAEVVRQFGFAPTAGAAVNVALLSHGSVACIGIEADRQAVPDDVVLVDSLVEGFDDVLGAIGRRSTVRV